VILRKQRHHPLCSSALRPYNVRSMTPNSASKTSATGLRPVSGRDLRTEEEQGYQPVKSYRLRRLAHQGAGTSAANLSSTPFRPLRCPFNQSRAGRGKGRMSQQERRRAA